mgnify:CR=1 FL=1
MSVESKLLGRSLAMLLPRFLHKWYANTMGYFWLPCPRCGEMFGGHEWTWSSAIDYYEPGSGVGCCPKHNKEGNRYLYKKEELTID